MKYTSDEKIVNWRGSQGINHPTLHSCNTITLIQVHHDIFQPVLFGGDQLTAARARGSQQIRLNSERASDRLQGLIPVAEDWHTSVILLTVSELLACDPVIITNLWYNR